MDAELVEYIGVLVDERSTQDIIEAMEERAAREADASEDTK